tara:strand:- start:352 stop:1212 length:861 start_codon:yes stop_codon:yes gene_type:complete
MKKIKYFIEFIFILFLIIIFKCLGYKTSSNLGALIVGFFGPLFRSKKIILNNLKKTNLNFSDDDTQKIINNMWKNYGRILAEYVHIKNFRNSKLKKFLSIEGEEILKEVSKNNEPVVFVSGHFNNFELMAMQIEKSGVNLAAIYRPLNNIFLNRIMISIRKKYICKNQIKKGLGGTREILKLFKKNHSVALMIDQRVSEGILSNFYGRPALTTTIPAQLVKKYKCKVITLYIERINNVHFKLYVNKPINFNQSLSIEEITQDLNYRLENMISFNPSQWIWSHNRWK